MCESMSTAVDPSTARELIQKGILQLCNQYMIFKEQLQIVGVLCLTADEGDDTIIKLNNTIKRMGNTPIPISKAATSSSFISHNSGVSSKIVPIAADVGSNKHQTKNKHKKKPSAEMVQARSVVADEASGKKLPPPGIFTESGNTADAPHTYDAFSTVTADSSTGLTQLVIRGKTTPDAGSTVTAVSSLHQVQSTNTTTDISNSMVAKLLQTPISHQGRMRSILPNPLVLSSQSVNQTEKSQAVTLSSTAQMSIQHRSLVSDGQIVGNKTALPRLISMLKQRTTGATNSVTPICIVPDDTYSADKLDTSDTTNTDIGPTIYEEDGVIRLKEENMPVDKITASDNTDTESAMYTNDIVHSSWTDQSYTGFEPMGGGSSSDIDQVTPKPGKSENNNNKHKRKHVVPEGPLVDVADVPDMIVEQTEWRDAPGEASVSKHVKLLSPCQTREYLGRRTIPDDEEVMYSCGKCKMAVKGISAYVQHSVKKHRSFSCHDCNKRFPNKGQLLRHRAIHTGIKKFTCKMCDKGFARKDKCKDHIIQSHTLGKPVQN